MPRRFAHCVATPTGSSLGVAGNSVTDVVPGVPHHITQRGVRRMDVFFTDDDRKEYLSQLRVQGERFGVRYLAWCLMTNHIHLVAVPHDEKSMAKAIGAAHKRYSRMISFRDESRHELHGNSQAAQHR